MLLHMAPLPYLVYTQAMGWLDNSRVVCVLCLCIHNVLHANGDIVMPTVTQTPQGEACPK